MQQDIRILKQKCNAAMIAHVSWSRLVKLFPRTPEKAPSVLIHPLKLHAKTCYIVDNSAVIELITEFHSNFVRCLNA